MTLEELINLIDEAEENYYEKFESDYRRNEFLARYIYDALHPTAREVDAAVSEAA